MPRGAACALAAVMSLACRQREPAPPPAPAAPTRMEPPPARGSVMLALPVSAYHASIAVDGEVFYLLTAGAVYRLPPDRPVAETRIDLGPGATMTRSSFIHWSEGAIRATPRDAAAGGGEARRLVTLSERPQLLIATATSSDDEIAWVGRSADGRVRLQALGPKRPRTLYVASGTIDAAVVVDGAIVFVEGLAAGSWRIGRVAPSGGAVTLSPIHKGRSPAMLAGRRDVLYYDGNHYEVRRLSPDLQQEETLAADIVCSPIAVADGVYCAQVEGLVQVMPGAKPRRLTDGSAGGVVADLAATTHRLLWIVDAGADRLEVRSLAL